MNIDDMPAGREMDALVAEKVMGWPSCELAHEEAISYRCFCTCKGPSRGAWNAESPWRPSADIGAAWEIVERMRLGRSDFSLDYNVASEDGLQYPAEATFFTMIEPYYAKADSAPLAICRAALKAVDV